MKRKIVAITASVDSDSRAKQMENIEWYAECLGNELYGVIHLSYTYTFHEINTILLTLKSNDITSILMDIGNIPSALVTDLTLYIREIGLEYMGINRQGIYHDDKYLFLFLNNDIYFETEFFTKLFLKNAVSDVFILMETDDIYQNKYIYKIKTITEILNIGFHIYCMIPDERNPIGIELNKKGKEKNGF